MYGNGDLHHPHHPPLQPNQNFHLLSILPKEKLTGPNYMDWLHSLKMTLRYENKDYVLENPTLEIDKATATPDELVDYNQHVESNTIYKEVIRSLGDNYQT